MAGRKELKSVFLPCLFCTFSEDLDLCFVSPTLTFRLCGNISLFCKAARNKGVKNLRPPAAFMCWWAYYICMLCTHYTYFGKTADQWSKVICRWVNINVNSWFTSNSFLPRQVFRSCIKWHYCDFPCRNAGLSQWPNYCSLATHCCAWFAVLFMSLLLACEKQIWFNLVSNEGILHWIRFPHVENKIRANTQCGSVESQ